MKTEGVGWAGPSRRARVIAVLLSLTLAAITFAIVSRVWRQAAPPPRPTTVEVRLVPLSSPAPSPAASR